MKSGRWLIVIALVILSLVACGEESDRPNNDDGNGSSPSVDAGSGECVEGEQIETSSGLVYEDIECGDGTEAEGDSSVVVHYVGTLEDGTTFDSSRDRGEPVPFTLGIGQLIPGFEEGIRGMKEGGTRKLTIPPELGYGSQGQGPIPPDATLIFEIELLSVEDAAAGG